MEAKFGQNHPTKMLEIHWYYKDDGRNQQKSLIWHVFTGIRDVQTIPPFFSTLLLSCLRLVFPLQTGFEQGKQLFHRRASYQRADRE
jgi:hypothetical protein